MTTMKVLKIKTGEVYINDKSYSVFQNAWEKKSKDGTIYYEIRTPVFVQVVEPKKQKVSTTQLGA